MARRDVAVRVEGARELRRKLKALESDLGDLKAVHHEAAELVTRTARELVPVRSGALRDSIRSSGTKTRGQVRAGFARVPYAGPLHFGHRPRAQGGFMRPQPFLYDALDARRQEVIDTYDARIGRLIEENQL